VSAASTVRGVHGGSRVGRVLWPALVLLTLTYVVADFVRNPLIDSIGDAAVRPAALTLWVPSTESGTDTSVLAGEAARRLSLPSGRTVTTTVAGGASAAVERFLGSPCRSCGRLLAVSSTTLADIARDADDTEFPDGPVRAQHARDLLQHATAIGVLSDDPLTLAVRPTSGIRTGAQLAAGLRARPHQQVFAIADDTYTKDNLASLVRETRVHGHVPYRVYSSSQVASLALPAGNADVVLAPRSALLPDIRAGRLRALAWPLPGGAPRAWTALIAGRGLGAADVAALRRQVRGLAADAGWLTMLRRGGRAAAHGTDASAAQAFLRQRMDWTLGLARVVKRVDRR
jgi:hypothetical protein